MILLLSVVFVCFVLTFLYAIKWYRDSGQEITVLDCLFLVVLSYFFGVPFILSVALGKCIDFMGRTVVFKAKK